MIKKYCFNIILVIIIVAMGFVTAINADTLILKDNTQITGEVIKEKDTFIILLNEQGETLKIPRNKLVKISYGENDSSSNPHNKKNSSTKKDGPLEIETIKTEEKNQAVSPINLYTFFVNIVHEEFRFPLIGFVNIAGGNHSFPQMGFVNSNQNNFSSLQLGFVNTAGGNVAGLQIGFLNTIVKSFAGMQFGFVNTAVGEDAKGLQLGFVNTTIHQFNGAQISFVNTAKQLNGLQLGFINYSDSLEQGVPIGFLSIVRHGGYRAVELGVSEISPFNLSFKIGVERFYTSFILAYNPLKEAIQEQVFGGIAFGSIVRIGETFYLNPEIALHSMIDNSFQNYLSMVPYLGYNIMSHLSIVAGPSLVWAHNKNGVGSPFYQIIEYSINDTNKVSLGARLAIRFHW